MMFFLPEATRFEKSIQNRLHEHGMPCSCEESPDEI